MPMRANTNISILTYHSVDESGSIISTAPDVFRRQMKCLSDWGYISVSLGELSASLSAGGELPARSIVLTFDDGFQNFHRSAFPVLSEFGFKATVFLVTDHCGGKNEWHGNPPELRSSKLLSWNEIKELDGYGIEFGSHTLTHPDLSRLPISAVRREMAESKATIEAKIGKKVTTFAYPFGSFSFETIQAAEQNFELACSTDLGKVTCRSNRFSLERIDSYYLRSPLVFDSFSARRFDRYVQFRASLRKFKKLVSSAY